GWLDISLDVIEAVLSDEALADWDGFGVVVQAYGPRATYVIDWLASLAEKLDRRIMVRLVKGAYWDTEIKRAQVLGLSGFPVFTRKTTTDVSYIACARKLLKNAGRIYPQFATHNAHTIAAVLSIAKSEGDPAFEFQRLHGMGEALHNAVMGSENTSCRIYAPVGAHEDLLAYLVRRLLENGANSSFVNQIVDKNVPIEKIIADPFKAAEKILSETTNPNIALPSALFGTTRENAKGWDVADILDQNFIKRAISKPISIKHVDPLLAQRAFSGGKTGVERRNPANPDQITGYTRDTSDAEVEQALMDAFSTRKSWSMKQVSERAEILRKAAKLYELNAETLFKFACQEAGKTAIDAVAELREAVDFLYFYANEVERLSERGVLEGRGVFTCISPWNFPLAIFTGQIAAALAAGNVVLAKPAEQTPLIAAYAVDLLYQAGIPKAVLQLLPGKGAIVGAKLVSDRRVAGVCFTGSTPTAMAINRAMAKHADPSAPLIAETGGINAMIVDSSALPEQAVGDIVASAFQSAGQRCSALRVLYVQEDIAPKLLKMLTGAMEALVVGDPSNIGTDIGPVIDNLAKQKIDTHISDANRQGRVILQLNTPTGGGTFVGPALIRVSGIEDVADEIFGPVLHIATYRAEELSSVVRAINNRGFGLTFGLHTRIDDRVQAIVDQVKCGNIYINRNQIGAVVASQPFGGEGLSGTGPKAGGPSYVQRFIKPKEHPETVEVEAGTILSKDDIQQALENVTFIQTCLEEMDMHGPTGESNRFSHFSRGKVLCLGPTAEDALEQAKIAQGFGCSTLAIAPELSGEGALDGRIQAECLQQLAGFDVVVSWAGPDTLKQMRAALAGRNGPLVPLITDSDFSQCLIERHVCIDTTAAGGNASLLASA
ncbi:MAG: bifunctional proline dehydrogenase/L-glutamate gamma-semialdehyde dehydrogenase PutA, partial [Hyphomicrobiales bacterium]